MNVPQQPSANTNEQPPKVPTEFSDSPLVEASPAQAPFIHRESVRWWLKLCLQPLLFLLCGVTLIVSLGLAQRFGWIQAGMIAAGSGAAAASNTSYICPMMCTPPSSEPGRCPVCAMELVPATSNSGGGDGDSVDITPAARRIADIQTAKVVAQPAWRDIRAVGEIAYDEGTLKTIAAYVDGRIEKLYADFTGVSVARGDNLVLLYSPDLYSSQVELLLARKALNQASGSTLSRIAETNQGLYQSARQRLLEMGLTDEQIRDLEEADEASSRLRISAPNQGTVIEKLAVEGQYVTEGQPIYKLADLSTVWLMLELFPEDAAAIRYGQKVEATVQSLPAESFTGRVAFVDPNVNPKTRTVGIRVVFPNESGRLRVGDLAKATIRVPVSAPGEAPRFVYDPELANRWISPRHPHIVQDEPGLCPICGVELEPAEKFGFIDSDSQHASTCLVPREAVLMAGDHSIVYVETEPGRFEIRPITLGPALGNQLVVFEGLRDGESVATNGNFLIDSQMQLAGNPSLIDPTRYSEDSEFEFSEEMLAAISELPAADQELVRAQKICPVADMALGSMGVPIKVDLDGTPVFICCAGCEKRLRESPEEYLAKLESQSDSAELDPEILAALDQLAPADRELALQQRICPVADFPLGSMGVPIKVDVQGTPVFICCDGCRGRLLADPDKYLSMLEQAATETIGPAVPLGPGVPMIGELELLSDDSLAPAIGDIELLVEPTVGSESSNPMQREASRDDTDVEVKR